MNCHDFDERIQRLLDERRPLAGDAQLHAHSLACSACEVTLAAYGALLHGTKMLPQPTLGAGFTRKTVAAVEADAIGREFRAGSPSRRQWLAPLGAVAALVLLAIGLGAWNWKGDSAIESGPVAASADKGPASPTPPRGIVGIGIPGRVAKAPPATAAVRQPASIARPSVEHPASSLSPAGPDYASPAYYSYGTAIESLATQLPGAVEQFNALGTEAPGIRPIRESFSTAFETLLKALPGRSDSREELRPQAGFPHQGAKGLA